MTNWNETQSVHMVLGAPGWSNGVAADTDVTLVLTLQIIRYIPGLVKLLQTNILHWQGKPSVVLIVLAGATQESIGALMVAFNAIVKTDMENALLAVIAKREIDGICRKALLNMASDIVSMRWFVQGLEIEWGLLISTDTAALVHRTANDRALHKTTKVVKRSPK